MNTIQYLLAGLLVLLSACQNGEPDTQEKGHEHDGHSHAHDGHGHEGHDHSGHAHGAEAVEKDVLTLSYRQMEMMEIETGQIPMVNLHGTVTARGHLRLPPQNQASVSALTGGIVDKIYVVEGDYVKEGQVLVRLKHTDIISVQEEYLASAGRLEFLRKDLERGNTLREGRAASEKDVQRLQAEYRAELARHNGLRARLELLGISPETLSAETIRGSVNLRTPISGYVRIVDVNMGQYVEPMSRLFEVVDNRHIHLDLHVYERDIRKISKGQKVYFTLPKHEGTEMEARIFAVGKAFEDASSSVVVHAEIRGEAPEGLLPGMYVNSRIAVEEDSVRALPGDAVLNEGDLYYIFVVNKDWPQEGRREFRMVEVKAGRSEGGFTEIEALEELGPHTQVVRKGAYYLLAELKKDEGGHGHGHAH